MKHTASFLRSQGLWLLLLLLLSLPALIALFHPGFMQTDDGNWMVIRFSAFYQALRDGQFPVRWLGRLNSGYGYPVADFLYPGFLYLGVPLQILTSNVVTTVKLLFGLSLVTGSVGMYLWLSSKFDRFGALVGALVYLYTPYHLYDMTQRGSLGEILALAVVPFVFWALAKGYLGFFSFVLALLILSHNTLAVLFVPLVVLYAMILFGKETKKIQRFALFFLLGIGLSCFFWLPALYDLRYTVFHQTVISNWRQYFAGMSLIGWGTLAVLLSAIALLLSKRTAITKQRQLLVILFIIAAGFSLFVSTSLSSLLWHVLPVQFVQFPFRFLSLTVFATAFLAAWVVEKRMLAGIVLVILVFLTSLPFLTAKSYQLQEVGYFDTNEATTTVKNEYMPVWVRQLPTTHVDTVVATLSNGVEKSAKTSHGFSFAMTSPIQTSVVINQLFFPGWEVLIDGKKADISPSSPQGLITVSIPSGHHQIRGRFVETPLRLFADILSILSLLVIGSFFFTTNKAYAKK